jgi:hypothetical protein
MVSSCRENPVSGYPFHARKTDGWSTGDRDTIRRLRVQLPGKESPDGREGEPPIPVTEELGLP